MAGLRSDFVRTVSELRSDRGRTTIGLSANRERTEIVLIGISFRGLPQFLKVHVGGAAST